MTSIGVYGSFILIITISIFVHPHAAEKNNAIKAVLANISTICDEVEELPEKVCGTTVEIIGKEVTNVCTEGARLLCKSIPWFLQILISSETCEKDLDEYICGTIEEITTEVLDHVEEECVEELESILIGHGCDANGDKVSMCDGLPTTVDGICTTIVDAVCEKLPSLLHAFTPFCQITFDKLLCQDAVKAATNPTNFYYGWGDSPYTMSAGL